MEPPRNAFEWPRIGWYVGMQLQVGDVSKLLKPFDYIEHEGGMELCGRGGRERRHKARFNAARNRRLREQDDDGPHAKIVD